MEMILADVREVTLSVLLPLLVALIAYYARKGGALLVSQLEAKAGANRTNFLGTLVTHWIFAAEQTHGLGTGEQKKAYVINLIRNAAIRYKFDLTDEEISAMVEGSIAQLKRQNLI